jgi:HSP20 family molecular chaperone IbpA
VAEKNHKGEKKMSNMNNVCNETIKSYSILMAAPGANTENTTVHADKGPPDGKSQVFVKVGNPDVDEVFLEEIEFTLDRSFEIPPQFDIDTVSATIKDGLIIINVDASEDRISEVKLNKD